MKKNNFNKTIAFTSISKKEWRTPQVQKIDLIQKLTLGGSGVKFEGMDIKNTQKRPNFPFL